MFDDELGSDVEDELFWEPRVDKAAIAVATDDGDATLRGTVGSFHEKREATKAAKRVYGVASVENELSVRLLDDDRRDDADLRGAVLQALMLDAIVPASIDEKAFKRDASLDAEGLSIDTFDGTVRLSGNVESWAEHDSAVSAAWAAPGVRSVEDRIAVDH